MGYIAHDAVIITVSDYALDRDFMPDVAAFVESMPDEFRSLVVGPIRSVVDGYVTWFFAPDGSKEWWSTSDRCDEWRRRFVDLFTFAYEDGSGPFDVVTVRFGGDFGGECGPLVTDPLDDEDEQTRRAKEQGK